MAGTRRTGGTGRGRRSDSYGHGVLHGRAGSDPSGPLRTARSAGVVRDLRLLASCGDGPDVHRRADVGRCHRGHRRCERPRPCCCAHRRRRTGSRPVAGPLRDPAARLGHGFHLPAGHRGFQFRPGFDRDRRRTSAPVGGQFRQPALRATCLDDPARVGRHQSTHPRARDDRPGDPVRRQRTMAQSAVGAGAHGDRDRPRPVLGCPRPQRRSHRPGSAGTADHRTSGHQHHRPHPGRPWWIGGGRRGSGRRSGCGSDLRAARRLPDQHRLRVPRERHGRYRRWHVRRAERLWQPSTAAPEHSSPGYGQPLWWSCSC